MSLNIDAMFIKILILSVLFLSFNAKAKEIELLVSNPVLENIPDGPEGEQIRYGFELLVHTAKYLGPNGSVKKYVNTRMSCTNCHLDAGRKEFGNSWLDTHGIYPQYRGRENQVLTLGDRANNCFEHPMNGTRVPLDSKEMRAILMYYKWLGNGRSILPKDPANRLIPLNFLKRAADPKRGKVVFENNCIACHQADGLGKLNEQKTAFIYPPLWGKESYKEGSSMSRISVLARFIKANMPFGATAKEPLLSDEDSWDVAAFVNSQPRPKWKGESNFKRLSEKPYDYPIPPYADAFSNEQHKYGPYQPIVDYWQADVNEGDMTYIPSLKMERKLTLSKKKSL